jgi:flagellar basal-body rod modification protein FlgD
MSLSALSTATNLNSSTPQTTRKTTLSQEDFLNLFVTQLRNQNPLEPLDSAQMAAQMTQFSSLEALNNISKSLQNLNAYQASINNLQVSGLIGKKVEASGNSLSVSGGKVSEGYYQLGKSGKVTIRIYNGGGNLIRTIEAGVKDTSKQTLTWDGKNQNGESVADGAYTFSVSAVDGGGNSIAVNSRMGNTVSGITFENGVTYLQCGSNKISLSDITAILN